MIEFWFKFQRQTITWTNDDPIHWHKYAALVGDELTTHNVAIMLMEIKKTMKSSDIGYRTLTLEITFKS